MKIPCTGFTVFLNSAKMGHRGGIALFVKPYFSQYVKNLNMSYENVIRFELCFMTGIVFVGCYITLYVLLLWCCITEKGLQNVGQKHYSRKQFKAESILGIFQLL